MDEVIVSPPASPTPKSAASQPAAASSAAPVRPWRPGFLARTWHLWALLAITVIGGTLRFYHLERPPIWYDEANTFARVTGTWDQMFDQLKTDGFMPLHYVITWWIGKH